MLGVRNLRPLARSIPVWWVVTCTAQRTAIRATSSLHLLPTALQDPLGTLVCCPRALSRFIGTRWSCELSYNGSYDLSGLSRKILEPRIASCWCVCHLWSTEGTQLMTLASRSPTWARTRTHHIIKKVDSIWVPYAKLCVVCEDMRAGCICHVAGIFASQMQAVAFMQPRTRYAGANFPGTIQRCTRLQSLSMHPRGWGKSGIYSETV